eukprot:gene19496-26159_t
MSKTSGNESRPLLERIGAAPKMTFAVFHQRLVLAWFVLTFTGVIWSLGLTLYCAISSYAAAAVIPCYFAYIRGPGKLASESLSWEPRLRRWSIWKLMAHYFDARLIKTTELDPSCNYLFAMMPHGIASISGWLSFCTDATGFSQIFPGINCRCLTLDPIFSAPIIREYALLQGIRSVGKRSINNILTGGPGSSVVLVPGGATESLMASPGTMDLCLARRKGFVRMALKTGAALVPVMAFGENELFHTFVAPEGTMTDKVLKFVKKTTGFGVPLFWGFGLLGGKGLLPYAQPLNTVVGKPIHLPSYMRPINDGQTYVRTYLIPYAQLLNTVIGKPIQLPRYVPGMTYAEGVEAESDTESDTGEGSTAKLGGLTQQYHHDFMRATQQLYDDYKDKFAPDRIREMQFL